MSFFDVTEALLISFGQNCFIFFATLLGAIPLGMVITFATTSRFRPIRYIMRTIVWTIRGTPLMLQLFIIFYVPGLISYGLALPRMSATIIAFIINYAAYFSEIYRGGIESIPRGQYEAGQVLGMKKSQIFFKVVLFQVTKRIVPPMGNEIITLVKDTSLARVISVDEILRQAERYSAAGYIWPIFYTGVFFLLFVGLLTIFFNFIEKKMNYYQG